MSEQVKRVNKELEVYGNNPKGEPLFRIVFSDDQIELRFGIFREFYGRIFIREIAGLREVPKYNYLKKAWVLERWLPPEKVYTAEIPATKYGSYEPLFAFIDDNYKAIPIVLTEVQRIIQAALNPVKGNRLSEQEEFDREVKRNEEEIAEAGRTWVGHRLHSGEGIVKP